jgi:group II intron reverse transcriptase/maturase
MAKGGRDSDDEAREVREMRTAEQVLGIIHERGRRGLPLEDVYRQLYNPELYLQAYGKLYRNAGAMTKGTTPETVDGMSQEKIRGLIVLLREEKYRWTPVRRVNIPKKNNPAKTRPLGIPTWSDKLLQEVIRMILEAYYEPQFDPHSHGFRPRRGCHTALQEITQTWRGTTWFIEGDIKGCFDNIDHAVLLATIAEKVHDNRFLLLLKGLLEAGYLEDWKYNRTLSGTPQGGVVSPILANIYLDRLDKYVAETLVPRHTRGTRRRMNSAYNVQNVTAHRLRRYGKLEEAKALWEEARKLPSRDPQDPNFRRLRYVRYADDFLLGYIGTHEEAEGIKTQLRTFLHDELKLDLSEEKTLVTHARTGRARFLGYDVSIIKADTQKNDGQRTINGTVRLDAPLEVVRDRCSRHMSGGKPVHRMEMTHNNAYSTVAQYQAEYRGLVEYYRMAHNLHAFQHLKWVMEVSLTKTLAHKYKVSVPQIYRRHAARGLNNAGRTVKVLRVEVEREGKKPLVAQWGGISLARRDNVILDDAPEPVRNTYTEVVKRLLANECELCGSTENVQVHHVRKMADLKHRGPDVPNWKKTMASRYRKTLVVCHRCHVDIHAGRPLRNLVESPGEPDDAKASRPVRRGADGKRT